MLLPHAPHATACHRFEPCGLVDIEFGWEGCIMIGHDTGGLGKMPGVYFTVQSSAQVGGRGVGGGHVCVCVCVGGGR